jgi:hypothetical protein
MVCLVIYKFKKGNIWFGNVSFTFKGMLAMVENGKDTLGNDKQWWTHIESFLKRWRTYVKNDEKWQTYIGEWREMEDTC